MSGGCRSEQPERAVAGAAHRVVVQRDATDTTVLGEHAGLRPDLLGGEYATDRSEQRVAVEQLKVAGELLDSVDFGTPLHLDRHAGPRGISAHQVDRADRGRVLPANQPPAVAEQVKL